MVQRQKWIRVGLADKKHLIREYQNGLSRLFFVTEM